MSDHELNSFETELRRLRPASAPDAFVTRLQEVSGGDTACDKTATPVRTPVSVVPIWRNWLKWLAPVAGAALLLVWVLVQRPDQEPAPVELAENSPPPIIEEVELDKQLVAAFEGVAETPGGMPLRFRCYGWQEALTLRNASGDIEVEQRAPRLEIVPVGFDVY